MQFQLQAPSHYLSELYTLSCLPKGSYFHESSQGRFVSSTRMQKTAKETAQKVANFSQQVIDLIGVEKMRAVNSDSKDLHQKIFRFVILLSQQIDLACSGRTEEGGLTGAVKTYASDTASSEKIARAIELMKQKALDALQTIRDKLTDKEKFDDKTLKSFFRYTFDPKKLPFCPEKAFTNEEWFAAMEASTNLSPEPVSSSAYYGRYTTGLLYNQTRNLIDWNWINHIGTFDGVNIYLSALPIRTSGMDTLSDLETNEVKAVLSMNKAFETKSPGYFTSPIKPSEYKEKGIYQLQIPTPDCETIYFEMIMRGVEFIHWNVKNKRNINIHCKAGRGRSALILMCYLIKYQNMTARSAFDLIKGKRKQAGFSESSAEWRTLKNFERLHPQKDD